MAGDIRRTPEQIYDLILATKVPDPLSAIAVTNTPEFSAWEDRMQDYYDRLVVLRCQLHNAIPADTPIWIHGSTFKAWQGAVKDSERWAWEVKRRRQRAGTRSTPAQ